MFIHLNIKKNIKILKWILKNRVKMDAHIANIYIYNCSEKKCLAPPNAPFQNSPANPTISGGGGCSYPGIASATSEKTDALINFVMHFFSKVTLYGWKVEKH